MTPEDRRIKATAARQMLENPLFIQAFDAVANYLNAQTMTCDSDNAQKALRIVISQQLLAAVKREVTRVVQDGQVAEIQMDELEKKRSLMQRVMQR